MVDPASFYCVLPIFHSNQRREVLYFSYFRPNIISLRSQDNTTDLCWSYRIQDSMLVRWWEGEGWFVFSPVSVLVTVNCGDKRSSCPCPSHHSWQRQTCNCNVSLLFPPLETGQVRALWSAVHAGVENIQSEVGGGGTSFASVEVLIPFLWGGSLESRKGSRRIN